jgi:pyrroline-5-carboxylate reductase
MLSEEGVSKVAIIGGGNLGGAFAAGLLRKQVVAAEDLLVIEPKREQRDKLGVLNCKLAADVTAELSRYDAVLICVKPQDFAAAAVFIEPAILRSQLLITAMAGVPISKVTTLLGGHEKVIRCMPNLPAQVGFGITAYCSSGCDETDLFLGHTLLSAVGTTLKVSREELINAATALSGTGPAYLCYLIECLTAAAKELGFSEPEGRLLIEHTFHGTMHLLLQEGVTPIKLREMVTSEKGTTAAAIEVLERRGVREIWKEAVAAAANRAKELAG